MFTFLYSDSSSFDFTYSEDFATREQNTGKPIPVNNNNQYAYFGYSAKKVLPTAPLIPTKTVTDSDETNVEKNTLTSLGEVYNYTITHKVPDEIADFYYSNYEMQDELIPELERVSDVTVTDESGNDVTNKFVDMLGKRLIVKDVPTRHNLWMDCSKARKYGVEFSSVIDGLERCARDYKL